MCLSATRLQPEQFAFFDECKLTMEFTYANGKENPDCRCASAPLLTLAAAPGTANATGYIRIGDKCYINVGSQYAVLIQIACPIEVSENP